MCVLQSEHIDVECVSGEIFCRYSINSGHLFSLSCARVFLVYLGSDCSWVFIFNGVSFITLLFVLVCDSVL